MLNILLIDDHELFRTGIKFLLSELADNVHFAEASNCKAALHHAGTRPFQVLLLDFHLPDFSGIEALLVIRQHFEEAAIVVLSGEEDPELIRRIIDSGAAGFIPKSSSHVVMMAALKLIMAGGTYLPPHVLNCMGTSHASAKDKGLATVQHHASAPNPEGALSIMTPRQVDVLRLAMLGKANKVIARELDISEATVKAHLSAAFRSLGVKNRTEAVFAAARVGLQLPI